MTDESQTPLIIDDTCVHGKEIRTIVWGRPLGDSWQIHGQPKCKKCPDLILLKTTSQKPTAVRRVVESIIWSWTLTWGLG